MNINFLLLNKVNKIIELTELIYYSKQSDQPSGEVNIPETFIDKLSNYLEEFETTGRTSARVLHKYIDGFSPEEKGQVIALIWLGQYASCKQPEDFQNLIAQAVHLIPDNYATSYIIEKSFLAKYLRSGLEKINHHLWNN
ncbi:DUF3775 domain-containing protein [Anabaena sp. FACHB-709]|uniref:DUF3775 domain-containing protein n=2 Tax=Nostocaceae TaxID=1162 RepID=A0A1Z4KNM8_ANAVA|nr:MULTISPECIES: DUF3775 domain-containing protein [Nostocaceae]BAY70537.1 hypothetical protein NIES23_33420 [Trichormus variabilis NIES-23]HBW32249.1 DUF3775 domain-containing protein [Nostoc sp. UBA8866]MBD2173247.1 DUF3775 domain-containing protein [Anabaena cylindrica FACHB-318]MBD2264998.1 DUF3775 domain-containing protein [Anabaena sp. FACHB-709]MBD2274308.1 DUF3775 domain-containing protein [Nostoc sp. PCC 7120 = FACHB-418]